MNDQETMHTKNSDVDNFEETVDSMALSSSSYNPLQRLKIQNARNEKEILYWKNSKDIETIINNSVGVWKTINILGFGIGTKISESLNSYY